jgi:hypothetical protein
MPRLTHIARLGIIAFVLAGCANYDAKQAEQEPPLGTPPTVTLAGPVTITLPDSLTVQAHIVPGVFSFADFAFGCSDGAEIVKQAVTRLQPDRIDLAATVSFSRTGSYSVWVRVWDTEDQNAMDTLQVTVH